MVESLKEHPNIEYSDSDFDEITEEADELEERNLGLTNGEKSRVLQRIEEKSSTLRGDEKEAFEALPTVLKAVVAQLDPEAFRYLDFVSNLDFYRQIAQLKIPEIVDLFRSHIRNSTQNINRLTSRIYQDAEIREGGNSPIQTLGRQAHLIVEQLNSDTLGRLVDAEGKIPFFTKDGAKLALGSVFRKETQTKFIPTAASEISTLGQLDFETELFPPKEEKLEVQQFVIPPSKKAPDSSDEVPGEETKPVYNRIGQINPQVRKYFCRLLAKLTTNGEEAKYPSTPWKFLNVRRTKRWLANYQELQRSLMTILPKSEEMQQDGDMVLRFAQASTFFNIANQIVHPFEKPSEAANQEIPIGLVPFQIAGIEGPKKVNITFGRPDELYVEKIDGQKVSAEMANFISSFRERSKPDNGMSRKKNRRPITIENLIKEIYSKLGREAEIEFKIVEYKMAAGDAGPTSCLDPEEVKRNPNGGHIQTMYDYLFGILAVQAHMRNEMESFGNQALRFENLNGYPGYLDFEALAQTIEKHNLSTSGDLIYLCSGRKFVHRFVLDKTNFRQIGAQRLEPKYTEGLTSKEMETALKVLVSSIPPAEVETKKREKKKVAPEWEGIIFSEDRDFYLDPSQIKEINYWLHFKKQNILVLSVDQGKKDEDRMVQRKKRWELRLNLQTANFRLINVGETGQLQGRVKPLCDEGLFSYNNEKKSEAIKLLEDFRISLQTKLGKVISKNIFKNEKGFCEVESGVYWNPWNETYTLDLSELGNSSDPDKFYRLLISLETGRNFLVRCPFPDHADHNPSAQVDFAHGTVYCFSCLRRVHLRGAAKNGESKIQIPEINRFSTLRRPAEHESVLPERAAILKKLFGHFSAQFPQSPAAIYLAEKRGINPLEAWKIGLVGYARGGIYASIQKGEFPLTLPEACAVQIVKSQGKVTRDFITEPMIVFPLDWTQNSGDYSLTSLGRSNFLMRFLMAQPNNMRFLKLGRTDNSPHGLFGWDMIEQARERGEVAIVESPIDALTLRLQFSGCGENIPVIALGGLGDRGIATLVKNLNIKRIFYGLDNDEAGRKASQRIRAKIETETEVKTFSLFDLLIKWNPNIPQEGWKDLNELLMGTDWGEQYRYKPKKPEDNLQRKEGVLSQPTLT